MLQNQPIIWLVLVKGINHIITVAPNFRLIAITLISIGLGIAYQIEPVPTPFLSVVRRGKQAVDKLAEFVLILVTYIGFHFGGTRGKSGKIIIDPADQYMILGLAIGWNLCFFQTMIYEAVNGMATHPFIGQGGVIRFFEAPMLLTFFIIRTVVNNFAFRFHFIGFRKRNAQFNPFGEYSNILISHFSIGWHLVILVLMSCHFKKQAVCRGFQIYRRSKLSTHKNTFQSS